MCFLFSLSVVPAVATMVMSHPLSFPDVFTSIIIGLDVDADDVDNFSNVNREWREFVHKCVEKNSDIKVRKETERLGVGACHHE